MTDDEILGIKQRLKDDFAHYASKCLRVRSKSGQILPFLLNKGQNYVHSRLEQQKRETGKVRALILKGRQMGLSTLIGGRFYHQTTHRFGCQTFILTHALDATQNLYKMAQRFHEHCPLVIRPQVSTSNSKELTFGLLESGYKVGTAENKSVGRSSTIQLFHGSEVAFWSNADEHAKGIFQAIPDLPDTECILESTANGIGNFFHKMWCKAISGQSDYQAIFVPWYWEDGYTSNSSGLNLTEEEEMLYEIYSSDGLNKDNLAWRRIKVNGFSSDEEAALGFFKQEYPMCAEEAFRNPINNVFIHAKYVAIARKNKVESDTNLIIGVDPAIGDNDRTSIIRRRGRLAYKLESFRNHNTMEICGLLVQIIKNERPSKIYVDCIGIGAGVVDRMREMGYEQVEGVNVARKSNEKERFLNLRSQLYSELREWLCQEMPVQIPDSDELHGDLCGMGFKHTSIGQLQIEGKKDMKKRGMPSPDTADALMLTFYGGTYESSLNRMPTPLPMQRPGFFT